MTTTSNVVKVARFTLDSTIPFRGGIRRELFAVQHTMHRRLKLEIREDKGWFSSTFYITVKGDEACVDWFLREIRRMASSL